MTALALKGPEYAELLARTQPRVIHSEEENEHFIKILLELEHRCNEWTPAESRLAELLALLIEEYEEKNYPIKAVTPIDVLIELMEVNNLKQKDLVGVFGTEDAVAAVVRGEQEMTTEHIEKLSARFHVSPAVFFPV